MDEKRTLEKDHRVATLYGAKLCSLVAFESFLSSMLESLHSKKPKEPYALFGWRWFSSIHSLTTHVGSQHLRDLTITSLHSKTSLKLQPHFFMSINRTLFQSSRDESTRKRKSLLLLSITTYSTMNETQIRKCFK